MWLLEVSDKVSKREGRDPTFTGSFLRKKIMMLAEDDNNPPKQKKTVSTLSQIEHSAFHPM